MDIITLITDQTTAIYQRLHDMYALEIKINGIEEDAPTLTVTKCPSTVLNRAAWLWMQTTLQELQEALTALVTTYNGVNFIDPDTFQETAIPTIYIPRGLLITDDVLNQLTASFKAINALLDKLTEYAHVNE